MSYHTFDFFFYTEIIFLVNSTGYKFLPVKTSKFEVEAGDVLGITLSSTGGDISHVTGAQEAEYYFESPTEVIPGSQFSAGSLNKKTIRHLIRAHLSLLSKLELQATYTVTAGVVRIFSKFSNAIGQRNATKNLPVEVRTDDLLVGDRLLYFFLFFQRNLQKVILISGGILFSY